MKKLIMVIIMVIMGTLALADSYPNNGIIFNKKYTTFAEASRVIKYWAGDEPTSSLKCDYDDVYGDAYYNGTFLDLKMYCTHVGDSKEYWSDMHIYVYGDDKIKTILNKVNNGGTSFSFPTVKYSDIDTGESDSIVYIYFQQ